MPRRTVRSSNDSSPLRRARLARNWALDDVVMQIDLRRPAGVSGVTQSMVSGWELGRHTTSITHRKTLCAIYGEPPEVLFAHQDELSSARANEGTTAICWNVVIAALNDLAQLSGRE